MAKKKRKNIKKGVKGKRKTVPVRAENRSGSAIREPERTGDILCIVKTHLAGESRDLICSRAEMMQQVDTMTPTCIIHEERCVDESSEIAIRYKRF